MQPTVIYFIMFSILFTLIPEFEMINDHQVWTVQLRCGVMFHSAPPSTPADELTADDPILSLQKSVDKKYSAYAVEYSDNLNIRNRKIFFP